MNIAFLGMGIMGGSMALNCIKAGHSVTVWNRTSPKTKPLVEAGAKVAETAADAAHGREAVLLCVDDHRAVEQVLFGPQGAAEGIAAQAGSEVLVIDHSTISPIAETEFSEKLRKQSGAQLLDAPVTGGDAGAKAGTLSILVGGPAEAFARAEPLLKAMGKTITHIGPNIGDGQRCKLINQAVVMINLLATTEGMRLGEQLRLDMGKVLAGIGGGAASSWALNNLGPKWLARDFAPGFRLRHLLKDIRYAKEMLEAGGGQFEQYPALQLGLELLERADAAGFGSDATQSVGRIFDGQSGTKKS